jgi:hypothetical protein
MVSLTFIVVGFLVATVLVMALARGSTARWERDKRASIAARDDVSTRRTSSAGSAFRIPGALTRKGVAALRSQASRFPPVKVLARLLPDGREQGTSRVRPFRRQVVVLRSFLLGRKLRGGWWRESRSRALPVDREERDVALAREPSRAATDIRSDEASRSAGRQLWRRTVPRAPRRALAFLHRHEDVPDARIPHEDSDESPTAR